MSRRRFLSASALTIGGMTSLGALVGCGSSGGGGGGAAAGGSKAPFLAADYGGLTTKAWDDSIRALFTKRTGVPVKAVALDYGKFVAQIKSGHTSWGWVDAEAWVAFKYQDLFEPIPWDKLGVKPDDLYSLKGAPVNENSILQYLSSYVFGYRTDKNKKAPGTWAEFFDTKAFPGKRGIYNYPYGTVEVALLADGVAFDKLYPLDLDRAFRKLDTIKKDTVFWNTGAESQQLLVNDSADFIFGWNNRFSQLVDQGLPVEIQWAENLQILDVDVIPKNYPRPDLVIEFIKAAQDPQAQAKFAELSLNAPAHKAAYDLMDEKTKSRISTNPEYMASAVGAINDKWWGANIDDVTTKWTAWAGK